MESRDPKRRRVASNSWSGLPIDTLVAVASKHITSAATYAALRSVCRRWREVLPATVPRPRRLPPQAPFLLLFSRSPRDPAPAFFSPASNRTFSLRRLADAREGICVGSSYGWLLILDPGYNLTLRNPFTGDAIRVPSLVRSPALDPDHKQKLLSEHRHLVHRAILSSDPSADRDFLVVLFTSASVSRCFAWRNGDNFWTVREHPPFIPEEIVFYEDRRCFALGFRGECAVFDFATADGGDGFFTQVPNFAVSGVPFLIESAGHVWLVVGRTISSREDEFEIYRLDLSELPDKVTAVPEHGDLGGRIFFLGQHNSMSVASAHFPGFEGDTIYFTTINWRRLPPLGSYTWRDSCTVTIWKCQFKNGIARRRSVEGEFGAYSLFPKLWWVPPNLHKKLGE